ncbi:hypothetical protein C9439_00490 [archaeon SCG-AAA382B04]|nr:hypothetical protein C9439_00490 [archaeon SCG-AAA382B04]
MKEKKAIINQFHSSVSNHFLRNEPQEVLAFDSRFELSLVEEEYYKIVEKFPIELAQAFLSTNVHLPIAKSTKTNLVIPQECLKSKTDFLANTFGLPLDKTEISELKEAINECFGTKFNFISPTQIDGSKGIDKENEISLIDIGVGYMKEYKDSALFKTNCSDFGTKKEVLETIDSLNPKLLFISNLTSVEEVRDFIDELKEFGYKIQKDKIFDKEKALKARDLYKDFFKQHIDNIQKDKEYDPKIRTSDLKNWLINNSPSKHFIKK